MKTEEQMKRKQGKKDEKGKKRLTKRKDRTGVEKE